MNGRSNVFSESWCKLYSDVVRITALFCSLDGRAQPCPPVVDLGILDQDIPSGVLDCYGIENPASDTINVSA